VLGTPCPDLDSAELPPPLVAASACRARDGPFPGGAYTGCDFDREFFHGYLQ
jgi:hypothetical protein